MTATTNAESTTPTLHLARWTVTSGSQVQSRGAVVIASGDHQWEASAEGNGAVDALYRAVDRALAGVLTGHPRLIAYDVHAINAMLAEEHWAGAAESAGNRKRAQTGRNHDHSGRAKLDEEAGRIDTT